MILKPSFLYDNGIKYTVTQESEYLWETEKYASGFKWLQFTGLSDKQGIEIYEGDVVRWGMDGQECWIRYAVVELFPCLQFKIIYYVEEKTNAKKPTDNYIFGYSNFIYKQTDKYLEVIGNIYENPHLLEVKE
jgi:uncharacterized phage protein (TIGR01671 family)